MIFFFKWKTWKAWLNSGSRNPNPSSQLPAPVSSSKRHNFRNYAVTAEKSIETNSCDKVPNIENGKMQCFPYGRDGKRCKPKCNENHQFYQKFQGRPPSYLCIPPNRVDWKIRKFIPDCSPTHEIHLNGRQCEAGWEHRGQSTCVACPPGMYRPQDDPLCQLCPKVKSESLTKACQACVRLRVLLSKFPFYNESDVYILVS